MTGYSRIRCNTVQYKPTQLCQEKEQDTCTHQKPQLSAYTAFKGIHFHWKQKYAASTTATEAGTATLLSAVGCPLWLPLVYSRTHILCKLNRIIFLRAHAIDSYGGRKSVQVIPGAVWKTIPPWVIQWIICVQLYPHLNETWGQVGAARSLDWQLNANGGMRSAIWTMGDHWFLVTQEQSIAMHKCLRYKGRCWKQICPFKNKRAEQRGTCWLGTVKDISSLCDACVTSVCTGIGVLLFHVSWMGVG